MKENVGIPFPVAKDDQTGAKDDAGVRKEAAEVGISRIEQVQEMDNGPSPEGLVAGASESYQGAEEKLFEQSQLHDEL